jgi:hypothetical protein
VLYVGSSIPEEVERSASLAVALAAQDRFIAGRPLASEGEPFDFDLRPNRNGRGTNAETSALATPRKRK